MRLTLIMLKSITQPSLKNLFEFKKTIIVISVEKNNIVHKNCDAPFICLDSGIITQSPILQIIAINKPILIQESLKIFLFIFL